MPKLECVQAAVVNGAIVGATDSSQAWETLLPNSQNTVNVGGVLQGAVSGQTVMPGVVVDGVQCTTTVQGAPQG